MKRILVPTDFSSYAYYAAEVAASIAKRTEGRIFLLHAIEMPRYSVNDRFGEIADTTEGLFVLKRAKQEFQKLIAQPFFEGVNVVEVIQWEGVFETISEKAKEHQIDLIVMGSQGVTGAKEFFIGSNTEKVIRTAPCPVLTIKERMEHFEPKDVVFASNFYGEAKRSFEPIQTFIELFDADVHLLKVITPANFESTDYSRKLMHDFASEAGLRDYTVNIFNDMIVENGIHKFAAEVGAGVVAMETHGRTGLAHFFRQSLAEDVANHSNSPVLSVKMEPVKQKKGVIFPG
jgi:nucleotide-binding universal stress UspA family protein